MGTPQAAVPTLERILADGHDVVAVYTQPDRPSGRGNKISFSPVKEFALAHDLPVLQPTKIKTQEALEEFRSHQADGAVVVAYGRILPEAFLTAYPKGAINVHFSLLPKYRGAAPVNWAIVNGEIKTGVTTMQMDAGLDTGDILLQRETDIGAHETAPELMDRLSILGADLLSETLTNLDKIRLQKQNEVSVTHAPILHRDDGLIDWNRSASEIVNRVRGFQPFPSSFTFRDGARVTIWKANSVSSELVSGPGSIVQIDKDSIIVTCGVKTALAIKEVQIEGKRRMPVVDFLNGVKLKVGETLGN